MQQPTAPRYGPVRTSPCLSKFEFARAVGTLALQLSRSQDALQPGQRPMDVARELVLARRAPLLIRRYLPDGSHEDCPLQVLEVDALDS